MIKRFTYCNVNGIPEYVITDRLRSACVALHARIAECPGGPNTAAFEVKRPSLPFVSGRSVIMTSDAALRGTSSPGIGGYMHGFAWRLPLEPDDCTGRFEMPISVLEFVGIGINMIEFPTVVPEPMNYEYIMGSDSDNSVGSLIDEASKSENMQATCTELRSLDAYQLHAARTTLAQIYGEGNVFADAISRGWHDYIQSLQRQFGVTLIWLDLSPHSIQFFERVRAGFRRDVEQRKRKLSAGNGVRSGEADHPGPTDGPSFSPARLGKRPANTECCDDDDLAAVGAASGPAFSPPRATAASAAAGPSFTPPPSKSARATYTSLSMPAIGSGSGAAGPSFSPPRAAAPAMPAASSTPPARRPGAAAPPRPTARNGKATARYNPVSIDAWDSSQLELLSFIQNDTSDTALRPPDPTTIPNMISTVGSYVLHAVPPNSASKAESAWAHWAPVMDEFGTSHWRKNIDLSGTTRESRMLIARECMLQLMALIMIWRRMRAKSRANATAKPASALSVLLAVRAAHRVHGYAMPAASAMQKCLKGMKLEYVHLNGAEALLPHRKEPLTDDDVARMFDTNTGGARRGALVVDWSDVLYVSFKALVLFLRKSAMRKADALSLVFETQCVGFMRSNITWRVGGVMYNAMSPSLRKQLRPGDALIARPAGSKADPLAEYFGANPIYLPYGNEQFNAAAAMADLELLAPCRDDERATTPASRGNA